MFTKIKKICKVNVKGCDKCEKIFSNEKSLKKQGEIHHDHEMFKCGECRKICKTWIKLDIHLKEVHRQNSDAGVTSVVKTMKIQVHRN